MSVDAPASGRRPRSAVEAEIRPRGPYSLALLARAGDATRRSDERGVLRAVVRCANGPELVAVWQRRDGTLVVSAPSNEAVERLRFVLAVDDDHSDFLRRFARDPYIGQATWRLRGLRAARTATVTHALLRAFCGQLVDTRTARSIEGRIIRATTQPCDASLHEPPTTRDLGHVAPARLRELGLHARRGAALVRICRSLDPERLHAEPTATVVDRLVRERGLGPWSAGVVCLQGLGRNEHGLVGDLGLIKLLRALRGRPVEAAETAELLEPYGEWAGLASIYLLAAFSAGLVPAVHGRRRSRAAGRAPGAVEAPAAKRL